MKAVVEFTPSNLNSVLDMRSLLKTSKIKVADLTMDKKEDNLDQSMVQSKIDSIINLLRKNDYIHVSISASELISYFEGEAPSGDCITLSMVLELKWLLVHEIVELSELKKNNFNIDHQLLLTHPSEVFSAHLIATDWELTLASKDGDFNWIKKRLVDIDNWLKDSSLSTEQILYCNKLLSKFRSLTSIL